ncbi:MAG: IS701 family transposase [Nitrososphaerales archaeon]
MIPIVEFPSIVTSAAPWFEDVFTRPQLKNFQTYVSGIILSPIHTISYMNSMFYAHSDQSALNNFITDSTWSDQKLEDARYKYILEGIKRCEKDTEGRGIVILDDTLSHHESAKHMEFAGKFYDHADQSFTWGHDVVTTHLAKGRLSIPLSSEIYLKNEQLDEDYLASINRRTKKNKESLPEDVKQILESENFKTKNEIARELISKAFDKGIPFSYVIADSWFLNRETVSLIESLKKDWVFGCKSDRVVLMPSGWTSLSEWAKTLPKDKFKPVNVWYEKKKHVFYCCAANLKMRSLDGRRVRIVVSYDNKELEDDPHFYCTNRLDWNIYQILSLYARRWRVDVFYRDSKQNLGLEDYEVRKIRGARRHVSMVFTAHVLLVLGSAFVGTDSSEEKSVQQSAKLARDIRVAKAEASLDQTIGSRRRRVYAEVLTNLLVFVLKLGEKLKGEPRKIVQMLLSSKTMLLRSAKV